MSKLTEKQRLITPIGLNYLYFTIPDLATQAFETYKRREPSRRIFQVSNTESSNSTAAIVLSVIAMEAYRNRIVYFEGEKTGRRIDVSRTSVPESFAQIMGEKNGKFPFGKLEVVLTEAFIIRDVVVHSHIYEIDLRTDEYWEKFSHRQQRLEGYGDAKFREHVNNRIKKTKLLKLNVQPTKIGFEELFKVLIVFDLLIAMSHSVIGDSTPFQIYFRANDTYLTKISEILTYFFNRIWELSNMKFVGEIERVSKLLRTDFTSFISPNATDKVFITNLCPSCKRLGFRKRYDNASCNGCGLYIGLKPVSESMQRVVIEPRRRRRAKT